MNVDARMRLLVDRKDVVSSCRGCSKGDVRVAMLGREDGITARCKCNMNVEVTREL